MDSIITSNHPNQAIDSYDSTIYTRTVVVYSSYKFTKTDIENILQKDKDITIKPRKEKPEASKKSPCFFGKCSTYQVIVNNLNVYFKIHSTGCIHFVGIKTIESAMIVTERIVKLLDHIELHTLVLHVVPVMCNRRVSKAYEDGAKIVDRYKIYELVTSNPSLEAMCFIQDSRANIKFKSQSRWCLRGTYDFSLGCFTYIRKPEEDCSRSKSAKKNSRYVSFFIFPSGQCTCSSSTVEESLPFLDKISKLLQDGCC